jgi:DNA-binding IclR family transcriptional regulator
LPSGSQTLDRGLEALEVLARHPDGLSVGDLAAALSTHRAGIYRSLLTLESRRLVLRLDDGRYTLGVGLIELGRRVHVGLQDVATPELRSLADELRATTALTIRDGEEAVVAAVAEPRDTDMHIAYRPGLRHSVNRSAAGIVLLAAGPRQTGERQAITDARTAGWARSTGELLPGVTGVAASVSMLGRQPTAAISAVWISPRDESYAAERVVASANSIATAMGWGDGDSPA